ncbi:lipopolysaccharide assembly protein LapB [Alkalimarinus coralli]|uniref:lipopolysaccharide assembly protein LapB n=1 Tax=Alkalimarinus coralli TaxID=2935863 RepID=UPI00202AFCA1|nr:lipopolysaccharide assembly protein LapB [Alkalimarinus coralli]
METVFQWLMLVVAIGIGWALGYATRSKLFSGSDSPPSSNLKDRLKLLFEAYSDEAVDSFVQSLEVNGETIGMHLSIGKHFRKNGEVEKALLVHQNLMSRPEVPSHYSSEVIFELAKDYMVAGLLDRAESLFLQLKDSREFGQKSLMCLVDIYQQEKEWGKALNCGLTYHSSKGEDISVMLSHFLCELAELLIKEHDYWDARNKLREALALNKNCVRATLLLAEMHVSEGHYAEAVAVLRKVEGQNYRFIPEIVPVLFECSQQLKTEERFRQYLEKLSDRNELSSIVLAIAESYRREKGVSKAESFLSESLIKKPSLKGLDRLMDYRSLLVDSEGKQRDLSIVKQVTQLLLVDRPVYQCEGCGFSGEVLHWQCPSCKGWELIAPIEGVHGE